MLSDTEIQGIDEQLRHAVTPRSACVEALLVVQESRGWISDDALYDVAERLGMPAAELESIATFYNLIFRKEVGKHVVHVCDGISCWVMGNKAIRRKLEERLKIRAGETTSDGMFTLLPADCMGACDRAPAVIIDKKLYGPVTEADVDKIIDEFEDGK